MSITEKGNGLKIFKNFTLITKCTLQCSHSNSRYSHIHVRMYWYVINLISSISRRISMSVGHPGGITSWTPCHTQTSCGSGKVWGRSRNIERKIAIHCQNGQCSSMKLVANYNVLVFSHVRRCSCLSLSQATTVY